MKRYLLLLIIISSCSSSDNFHLNGNIKGLQKGTIILTKSMEGSEIVLDSVSLNGSSEFILSCLLEEPEVLKIKLVNAWSYCRSKRKEEFINLLHTMGKDPSVF